MITEEYFCRYQELQNLLERVYVDIYSLQEIDQYNESLQKNRENLIKCSFNILGHICELLKADLGLTIWKIYIDNDKKANTIPHLASYIYNLSLENKSPIVRIKTSLPTELRDVSKRLSAIRKNYLAHNDLVKQHASVQLSEMIELAKYLHETMNGLCYVDLDERVSPISDQQLLSMKMNVSLGLGLMIHKSNIPINIRKDEE